MHCSLQPVAELFSQLALLALRMPTSADQRKCSVCRLDRDHEYCRAAAAWFRALRDNKGRDATRGEEGGRRCALRPRPGHAGLASVKLARLSLFWPAWLASVTPCTRTVRTEHHARWDQQRHPAGRAPRERPAHEPPVPPVPPVPPGRCPGTEGPRLNSGWPDGRGRMGRTGLAGSRRKRYLPPLSRSLRI